MVGHSSQTYARYHFRLFSMTDQSQLARPEHNRINANIDTPSASLNDSFIKRKMFQREPLLKTGIILMGLGVLAMVAPSVSPLLSDVLISSLLVTGGVLRIVILSQYTFWSNFWSPLLGALLVTFIAMIMAAFPLYDSYTFTMLLTVLFLIEGIVTIVFALNFRRHSQRWFWILSNGFASLLVTLVVSHNWPSAPSWMIGTLTGLILLLTGIWYIIVVTALPRAYDLEKPDSHYINGC